MGSPIPGSGGGGGAGGHAGSSSSSSSSSSSLHHRSGGHQHGGTSDSDRQHRHHHHHHHQQHNHGSPAAAGSKSSSSSSKEDQRLARRYFQIQDRCLTVLRILFALGIPLTVINISFATIYAWIYANQYSYGKDDWQRCLIYPNQGGAEDKTDYLMAAASYAGRVFVFIIVVFKMAYVGVKDTDILPYSLFTNLMALLGIIVYREAEPIQPQPQQLSATLLTLIKYIKPGMYEFNAANKWAPTDCRTAYSLNKWFLIFQIMVVVLVCAIFVVVSTCAIANYRIGKRWTFQLKGNHYPLLLLVVAFGGYVTCFYAKETVAQLTLDVLRESKLASIFAFSKGELDIVSLTMMMTLGAIGVGTCKGDLEKFKLGALVAYFHVVLSYPSVLATMHAYNSVTYPYSKDKATAHAYNIWSMDPTTGCPAYILAKSSIFDRFPNEAHRLCRMCHLSLVGQLVQFAAQHFVVAACIYILWANRDLPAQRLRLGTYVPDYLGGLHVNVSVNAPIAGYKRKNTTKVVTGDYQLLQDSSAADQGGSGTDEERGGRGREESKASSGGSGGKKHVAIAGVV